MPLSDELLAHQINTLKLATGVGNTATPYVDLMKKVVRKRVAGFDSEKRTAARLEKMLIKLRDELNIPAGDWIKELKKENRDFRRRLTRSRTSLKRSYDLYEH